MSVYYNELPRKCYNLESSYRRESKTKQSPFVVASEVETDNATREFLIFHDLEHFLNMKNEYSHCHEIIRCPEERENLARGRLIFDFDLEQPLEGVSEGNFVPDNFNQIIETLIKHVFKTYYLDIDTERLVFIWQVTKHDDKFSKHLIVKNAYFSEYWVKQMRVFYELVRKTTEEFNIAQLTKVIDFQIARKNATFRMIGCSKIGKKPLELESPTEASIYDCLVGIYHHEHLREEQRITMSNINYTLLTQKLSNIKKKTKEEKRFNAVITKNISLGLDDPTSIDVTDNDVNRACYLYESWNLNCFKIRDKVGNLINLDRTRPSECPISGVIHERENAYLKMRQDGHVMFCCRRGCKAKNGVYGIDLGIYKSQKRPLGILPISVTKLKAVIHTKTFIDDTMREPAHTQTKSTTKSKGVSARRIGMIRDQVHIPMFLRVN